MKVRFLFLSIVIVLFGCKPRKFCYRCDENHKIVPSTYKIVEHIQNQDSLHTCSIKGTVMDEKGIEVIGASIVVSLSNNKKFISSVISDIDGKFSLLLPSKFIRRATLKVSYNGYTPIEIKIKEIKNGSIHITLVDNSILL